jgi:hypothetical protein
MPEAATHPDALAAVSWGQNRIDLFTVDEDRGLRHRALERGSWTIDEQLGGPLASGPAVTAWAIGRMEVFAVMPDGALWDRYWDGVVWHAWESLGGELDPSVAPSAS